MKSNSVGFWHGIRLHYDSNLADIYAGYPLHDDVGEVNGFVTGRKVTRWDRARVYLQTFNEHFYFEFIAPRICAIKGCDIEMESIATPDHGSEAWYCKRCYRGGSHTYY